MPKFGYLSQIMGYKETAQRNAKSAPPGLVTVGPISSHTQKVWHFYYQERKLPKVKNLIYDTLSHVAIKAPY